MNTPKTKLQILLEEIVTHDNPTRPYTIAQASVKPKRFFANANGLRVKLREGVRFQNANGYAVALVSDVQPLAASQSQGPFIARPPYRAKDRIEQAAVEGMSGWGYNVECDQPGDLCYAFVEGIRQITLQRDAAVEALRALVESSEPIDGVLEQAKALLALMSVPMDPEFFSPHTDPVEALSTL